MNQMKSNLKTVTLYNNAKEDYHGVVVDTTEYEYTFDGDDCSGSYFCSDGVREVLGVRYFKSVILSPENFEGATEVEIHINGDDYDDYHEAISKHGSHEMCCDHPLSIFKLMVENEHEAHEIVEAGKPVKIYVKVNQE